MSPQILLVLCALLGLLRNTAECLECSGGFSNDPLEPNDSGITASSVPFDTQSAVLSMCAGDIDKFSLDPLGYDTILVSINTTLLHNFTAVNPGAQLFDSEGIETGGSSSLASADGLYFYSLRTSDVGFTNPVYFSLTPVSVGEPPDPYHYSIMFHGCTTHGGYALGLGNCAGCFPSFDLDVSMCRESYITISLQVDQLLLGASIQMEIFFDTDKSFFTPQIENSNATIPVNQTHVELAPGYRRAVWEHTSLVAPYEITLEVDDDLANGVFLFTSGMDVHVHIVSCNSLCPNGTCPNSQGECETVCSKPSFLCNNGACVASVSECLQNAACPLALKACWDGECVETRDQCKAMPACELGLKRCPDGSCTEAVVECEPLFCAGSPCPDSTCVNVGETCAPFNGCPMLDPVQCFDGSCRSNINQCKCNSSELMRCFDGTCAATCPTPPRMIKPAPVSLTFNAAEESSFNIMDADDNNLICQIHIPSGAFGQGLVDLFVNPVADSLMREFEFNNWDSGSRNDMINILSAALDLTTSGAFLQGTVSITCNITIRGSMQVGQLCLGYLNLTSRVWECVDNNMSMETMSEGQIMVTGVTDHFTSFAVLFEGGSSYDQTEEEGTLENPSEDAESLVVYFTIGAIVLAFIAVIAGCIVLNVLRSREIRAIGKALDPLDEYPMGSPHRSQINKSLVEGKDSDSDIEPEETKPRKSRGRNSSSSTDSQSG